MHKSNWDDLRFVLAVAETGSVSAAARSLGVNHATVLRRIAAFEALHGTAVFERTARGYVVPPDRLRVIEAAREVENAVRAVDRLVHGARAPLRGVVRVTSTDTFCHVVLPPVLARLRDEEADLRLDLLSSNAHADLSRLHADIAVRPAEKLPDDLVGKVAARLGFAAYAARPAPDLWLGMSGALARSHPAQWLADTVVPELLAGSADSFLTLREMAAAGLGRAVLPCVLGDADVRLDRLPDAMPAMSVDIWVASHVDLADVPRIRAVRDRLVRALARQSDRLVGTART
jgi:DNA-binding transcriptional LysR family regulator